MVAMSYTEAERKTNPRFSFSILFLFFMAKLKG